MMETPPSGDHLIDVVLWVWFALTALAVAYVAKDQFKGGLDEKSLAMKTMRRGWVLLTLYTGVVALIILPVYRQRCQHLPTDIGEWSIPGAGIMDSTKQNTAYTFLPNNIM